MSRGGISGLTSDVRGLTASAERLQRDQRQAAEADVVIDGPRALKLRSPNGTYYALVVDDAGVLSTVNVGTSL